jgi:hypothetical protein
MSNGFKAVRVPNFLVFNSRTESFGNNSVFVFSLLLFTVYRFMYLLFGYDEFGVSDVSWLCFLMNMSDYPHVTTAEDGRLSSTDQHHQGFTRVLYDAFLHLGCNGDVPVYRGRMSIGHGLDQCDVSVTITLNPVEPWMATIIGIELDDSVKQTAQVALTSLCGNRLTDTAAMQIELFLICYQGDHMWKSCLTPRALNSMQAWLRWLSMRNTHSTYNTTSQGLSSSST